MTKLFFHKIAFGERKLLNPETVMKEISFKRFNEISFFTAIFLIFYMQFKNIEFNNFIPNLSLVDFLSFFIFFLCQFIIIYIFL